MDFNLAGHFKYRWYFKAWTKTKKKTKPQTTIIIIKHTQPKVGNPVWWTGKEMKVVKNR